jgi:hypothetical protein
MALAPLQYYPIPFQVVRGLSSEAAHNAVVKELQMGKGDPTTILE